MKTIGLLITFLGLVVLGSCNRNEPLPFEEQLSLDTQIIDNYLEEKDIVAEVHSSGLRYVIHEEGTGGTPNINSQIKVTYEGRYLDSDVVFDSNKNITFALNTLIDAWIYALPLIKEGGSMTIYAPSGLCYGTNGHALAGIPSNANMIFDMELVEIVQ